MYVESSKGKIRRLWDFHGGLHLPDNKRQSLQTDVTSATMPALLILPLHQHIGEPAIPLVKPGDRVLKGEKIADNNAPVCAPIHAPTSGIIKGIEAHPIPHPSGLNGPVILLEVDGEEEWTDLPAPISNFKNVDKSLLLRRVREAGIVGLGGATFPAAIKLNPGKAIKTLIINGAECEPFISCDDRLMQGAPERILNGVRILQHILGAEECLIGIEDNKPDAISTLRSHLADDDSIEVVRIPTLYPSGGEKQLIQILTGREVPSGGFPAQLGVICHNVATAAAIADAVLEGRPLISRLVTLTGDGIANPCNMEVPLGITAANLIEQAGGYTGKSSQLIMGGPMMGFNLSTDQVPITKGSNCLLVPSEEEVPTTGPALACIRCGRCAEVCPVNLLPQQMYWFSRARELEKVQDYNLFDCIECGCCSHVCPSHIPLVHYFRFAKTESWAMEKEQQAADHAKKRHDFRIARLERLDAERKARLRKKKEDLSKKKPLKPAATGEDAKKAAIEAAMKRAAAKKAALQSPPKNTDNLTPAQQKQVDAVDKHRAETTADQE